MKKCLIILTIAALATMAQAQSFTIVQIPDTQFYSQDYPATFTAQTQWIVDNKTSQNIAFVTHMGDVTNVGTDTTQWARAQTSMNLLNGVVPYSTCFGNHDVYWDSTGGAGIANCKAYFGDVVHQGGSTYGGSSPSGLAFFQTFSAGAFTMLNINLPFDPSPAEESWANGVLAAHRGLPTILSTHDYMNVDGTRSSAGNDIWTNVVNNNPQIFMTLAGHNHGESQLLSTDAAGNKVAQVLTDFQDYPNGGNGYLRTITFNPTAGQVQMKVYSPTLHQSMTDSASQYAYNASFNATTNSISLLGVAPTPIPAGSLSGTYSQNFDTDLGTTGTALPTGWTVKGLAGSNSTFVSASPITAAAIAAATTGTQTLGVWNQGASVPKAQDTAYNVGVSSSSTDRSLAMSPTSDAGTVLTLAMVNNTGAPVSQVRVKFDMKVMALGSTGGTEATELPGLSFFYSTDGTTWTGVDSMKLTNTTLNEVGHADGIINFANGVPTGGNFFFAWADDNNIPNSPDQIFGLDNVSVQAVPEPVTLSLLAIGGLAMLRRRK